MPAALRVPMLPASSANTYSTWMGFIYIFNIIVGTGALTLPAVFAKAGWLLSLISIMLLASISYMTVTYIIEAMACANAVRNWQRMQFSQDNNINAYADGVVIVQEQDDDNNDDSDGSVDYLLPSTRATTSDRVRLTSSYAYYHLHDKYELGEMSALFFNEVGRMFFYLCIAIYLYGDMSIYSAAIAKSLRNLICDLPNSTITANYSNLSNSSGDVYLPALTVALRISGITDDNDLSSSCWQNHTLSRISVYRLLLIGFTMLFGPFAASSVHKTKYLQLLTIVFRWLAFILMIALATKSLISNGVQGHPPAINIYGLPALYGACVYSFMCHHSLPSLLAPIRNKSKLRTTLAYDYMLICTFYVLLALTGIFAFDHLQDLYTLNFMPPHNDADHSFRTELLLVIDYFLALFPVFTLSASFPIIAITLRNNLQTLFLDMTQFDTYNYFVRRMIFPLAAILPPFCITYFTENLTSLVAFTGSYAGAGIQYLIPISLVYFGRKTCRDLLGNGVINGYQSPFSGSACLIFVFFWCAACVCLVTINLFY